MWGFYYEIFTAITNFGFEESYISTGLNDLITIYVCAFCHKKNKGLKSWTPNISDKGQDWLLFKEFDHLFYAYYTLHSADKFLNNQQILGFIQTW